MLPKPVTYSESIASRKDLNPTEKLIYSIWRSHHIGPPPGEENDPQNYLYFSHRCGLSIPTVRRSIRRLQKLGLYPPFLLRMVQ